MKNLVLSLFLLASSVANAQSIFSALHLNEQNDYKTRKPKKIAEINLATAKKNSLETYFKKFDDAGMLLTEERFDHNRNRTALLQYANDTTRHVVLSIRTEQWVAGLHLDKTSYYKYDTNNFLTGIEEKKDGMTVSLTTIKNNEKGNPVELTVTDVNGNIRGKEYAKYLYDTNQAIVSVANYKGETVSTDTIKISFRDQYKFPENGEIYNGKGDMISYTRKNPNGTYDHYECEYTYDKFGNCTEQYDFIITVNAYSKVFKQHVGSHLKHYFY